MAPLYQELATWLAMQAGKTLDTELFAGHMPPEEQANAIILLDRGGTPQGAASDGTVAHAAFQVLTRGQTYKTALDLAYAVFDVLHKTAQRIDLGEHLLLNAVATQRPSFIGFDSRGRYEFSHNYVVYVVSA